MKITSKLTALALIFFLILSCSGNDKEEYIKIYKDMYSELLHYVKLLEKIKKQGSVTPEIRKQILKSQSKIIKIKNRVDSFSKDYDNDSEIRKKLRKTLIKITIANYYIKRMQEKIKDLPGVNDLFIELQNKGMRK